MTGSSTAPRRLTSALRQYTIYFDPSDYPGLFVTRGWTVDSTGPKPDVAPAVVTDTLEAARLAVPCSCDFRVPPHLEDDPKIVEVWL